jgi:hypothetical protein
MGNTQLLGRLRSSKNADVAAKYQSRIFIQLQQLTDDELGIDKATGRVFISKKADDPQRSMGTGLIRAFVEGVTDEGGGQRTPDVTITDNADGRYSTKNEDQSRTPVPLDDNSYTSPQSLSAALNGAGTNSTIYHNPDVQAKYSVSESERKIAPAFIVLGHELIHALHNALGIRSAGTPVPQGHSTKNREEYNAQVKDRALFEENSLPGRYIEPIP